MSSVTDESEAKRFDAGMDRLLKADPAIVKAAMEQEKQEREEERKAKRVGKPNGKNCQ